MKKLLTLLLCLALLAGLLPSAQAAQPPAVTFTISSRQSIGETDATLACTVRTQDVDITAVSQVGVEVLRSGQTIAFKLEDASPWGDYIEAWFPLNSALNCFLTAGTTYQYRFYAVVDGLLCSGELMSFTTTGGVTATVTFDANGGAVSPESKTVDRTGTYGQLPVPSRPGYTFQCWSPQSSGEILRAVEANDPVDPREDHTLYARWQANSYTVTLDANGGSVERGFQPVRYGAAYGDSAALPDPSRPGQIFLGWYTAPSGGAKVTDDTAVATPANHTLYAHWRSENTPEGLGNFTVVRDYYNGLFQDVDAANEGHWFADNVAAVYELGLMRGTRENKFAPAQNTFSPEENMTVAQAVTIAARLHSIYYADGETFEVPDGGQWYDPYVNYARERRIISTGYDYALPATREEFVRILAHALPEEALAPINPPLSFADGWSVACRAEVDLLCRAGVITGVSQSGALYFKPQDTITRAEAAAIAARMVRPSLRVRWS